MKTSIGDGISTGVAALKSNPVAYIVGYIIVGVGSSVTLGLLAGPLLLGYVRMVVKGQKGQPVDLNDIFEPMKTAFLPAWIASFLGLAIVAIGYVPIFVLMLVLPPSLFMVFSLLGMVYFIAAEFFVVAYFSLLGLSGGYDWKKTLQDTLSFYKSDTAPRLIYNLVLGLVGGAGAIACGIGALVTIPIGFAGIVAGIGRETGALEAAPAPAPVQPAV